ncbi:class I SAM-dependent methyltransferase, partial [Chloroflexota bacterium]
MREQDIYKDRKSSKMNADWDMRAQQNALYYIVTRPSPQAISEFFEVGAQQAYALTSDTFKELAFDPSGKRILDIGCGIGRLFPGFAKMFAEVLGVDVSKEMIKRGAELCVWPNVMFLQNNGYNLADIPVRYFDFVFSYITFQHLPEKWMVSSYLTETYKVLKPSGVFQLHFPS